MSDTFDRSTAGREGPGTALRDRVRARRQVDQPYAQGRSRRRHRSGDQGCQRWRYRRSPGRSVPTRGAGADDLASIAEEENRLASDETESDEMALIRPRRRTPVNGVEAGSNGDQAEDGGGVATVDGHRAGGPAGRARAGRRRRERRRGPRAGAGATAVAGRRRGRATGGGAGAGAGTATAPPVARLRAARLRAARARGAAAAVRSATATTITPAS